MQNEQNISAVSGDTIELHYWFNDDSPTIDAIVQNRCECEILGVLKEIAQSFNTAITIETEPFGEGGLRRWFRVVPKLKTSRGTAVAALITALFGGIIVTPVTAPIGPQTDRLIKNILKDKKLKKLHGELALLKQEVSRSSQQLNDSTVIKRKRSNFFKLLQKYPRVSQVSITITDQEKNRVSDELIVDRGKFRQYVLISDNLDPVEEDNAIIEVVSPVLKRGRYKWRGIYQGSIISFDLKSDEFIALVQTGRVQFKNGTTIKCLLRIRRKIDNEGFEKITGYDVMRVNEYFENDKFVLTAEGKRNRTKEAALAQQLDLFDCEPVAFY
ncbi:hypothetical protein QA601_10515 [Chitinispirillales bacterium ANBcel5]|uniref:hypothetical protein n=1 Tax=Cellulosispirillum alkaliphilum TaxID=3039283 RepID=UPI002A58A208|nr:hypothetical protein [Chitinispirillales bacterium ANBcel5]